MATSTPNFSFTLPAIADPIDEDLWGTQLNANWSSLDTILQNQANDISNITTVPSGTVSDYAGSTAPAGWLLCHGQAVSRATFSDLFAVIGTTYGVGDGSTTFNVPDIRGRVVAGQDDMGGTSADRLTNQSGGVDGDTLGASGGAETHTLVVSEMPAHAHGYARENIVASQGAGIGVGGDDDNQNDVQTTSIGGDGAHNNVQPTIILNKIIKT